MNEKRNDSQPKQSPARDTWPKVAALVIAHLVLACLAPAASAWLEGYGGYSFLDPADFVIRPIAAGLFGLEIGQIVLLAAWLALADQHWLLRIPRFLILVAWALLVGFLGEYLWDRVFAPFLVEEQSAYKLLLLLAPVVALLGFRFVSRRQWKLRDSQRTKLTWQFSTRQLLLITAEVAALLALGRFVLAGRFSFAEFWTALTGNRPEEIIPAVVSVTVLPVVFLALARVRTWPRYLATGLWLLASSCTLPFCQLAQAYAAAGTVAPGYGWVDLGLASLDYISVHACAAATILLTFYLLRRIGYDFRRRDEGPLGRSSSNARNSAASASA